MGGGALSGKEHFSQEGGLTSRRRFDSGPPLYPCSLVCQRAFAAFDALSLRCSGVSSTSAAKLDGYKEKARRSQRRANERDSTVD